MNSNLNSLSVEIKDFSKVYELKKRQMKIACSGVDFLAKAGEVTGLLGPNGAGKSTLIKAICGVHYGTSGSVSVAGFSSIVEIRRRVGYVPETPELDGSLTVKETLYQEAMLHGIKKEVSRKFISEAVRITELEDVLFQKVSTLSKGYAQRTSLAKALSFDPEVLVLDEFSGGLDPVQIVKMRKTIKRLSEKKVVIFSTHHIEEAEALCSKIYVMNGGKVAASGVIDEVIAFSGKKNLEEAFLKFTCSGELEEENS